MKEIHTANITDHDFGNIASLAVDDTSYSIVWQVQYLSTSGWLLLSLNLPKEIVVEIDFNLDIKVSQEYGNVFRCADVKNLVKIAQYLHQKEIIKL